MAANGLPQAIMAQNEIDVPGQANQNASAAAQSWNATLAKYQDMGVRVSSPQIVWNVKLLSDTMNILKTQYNRVPDFIAIHWYGVRLDRSSLSSRTS
jgi:Glycosyl hydrolase catalytic core